MNLDVITSLIDSLKLISVSKKFIPSAYQCEGCHKLDLVYSWYNNDVSICPMDVEFEIPYGENVTADGDALEEFANTHPGGILFGHRYDTDERNPIDEWFRIELVD